MTSNKRSPWTALRWLLKVPQEEFFKVRVCGKQELFSCSPLLRRLRRRSPPQEETSMERPCRVTTSHVSSSMWSPYLVHTFLILQVPGSICLSSESSSVASRRREFDQRKGEHFRWWWRWMTDNNPPVLFCCNCWSVCVLSEDIRRVGEGAWATKLLSDATTVEIVGPASSSSFHYDYPPRSNVSLMIALSPYPVVVVAKELPWTRLIVFRGKLM